MAQVSQFSGDTWAIFKFINCPIKNCLTKFIIKKCILMNYIYIYKTCLTPKMIYHFILDVV